MINIRAIHVPVVAGGIEYVRLEGNSLKHEIHMSPVFNVRFGLFPSCLIKKQLTNLTKLLNHPTPRYVSAFYLVTCFCVDVRLSFNIFCTYFQNYSVPHLIVIYGVSRSLGLAKSIIPRSYNLLCFREGIINEILKITLLHRRIYIFLAET